MELIKGNFKDINEMYKYLIREFPENELKTLSQFKFLLEKPHYNLFKLVDGEIVGYALIYECIDDNTLLLDFIFIKEKYQGMGMGSILFKELENYYNSSYNGIFLEIETPTGNRDNPEDRRLKFYKKLGAEEIDCEYILPNQEGGLPMQLLYKPYNPAILSKNTIKNSIEDFFNIHYDVYNTDEIYEIIVNSL